MIKVALPAGDLRAPLAALLSGCGLTVEGYGEGSRSYRLGLPGREGVTVRVFREKDIPIQIALGNYDIGVCGLVYVREIQARFPAQPIAPLAGLPIGRARLYAAVAEGGPASLAELAALLRVRLASEFPNIAEAFARAARLPSYRVQAVWGAAAAYPPEDADVAVIAAADEDAVREQGLAPLFCLLESSAWLIANADAMAAKDLTSVLNPLLAASSREAADTALRLPPPVAGRPRSPNGAPPAAGDVLRLAVPDGHQQPHVWAALAASGLRFEGYEESSYVRRPPTGIAGLEVKVIRPHDMPQLVATGEMDAAITGRDCLNEHLYNFPSSPVQEVLDLRRAQYNLSAVVSEELPAENIGEAMAYWRSQGRPALRVAAELPGTADHYARSRHFWRYQVIPIAGASEGFVPEDADLLIEGTETGKTIAVNKLKVIDLLYRSTTCLIARREAALAGRRAAVYRELVAALARGAGG